MNRHTHSVTHPSQAHFASSAPRLGASLSSSDPSPPALPPWAAMRPGAKVIAIWALPAESLVEVMYSRLSMPFICCSITWVTESSTTFADAPG